MCATVNGATGWKNEKLYHNPFKELCNNTTRTNEAYECIKKNTYDLADMVYNTTDGDNTTVDESHWMMDISSITLGKCFTLNSSMFHIGTDIGQHLTFWYPDTNVTQKTLIHDPDFFLNGPNPRAIPRIMSIQNQDYGVKQEFLETVQHVKMNLPASPCQESASYSFTRCIRNAISKKVGCRTEWDYWSNQSRRICRDVFFMLYNFYLQAWHKQL